MWVDNEVEVRVSGRSYGKRIACFLNVCLAYTNLYTTK